jgi:hypothetical protein
MQQQKAPTDAEIFTLTLTNQEVALIGQAIGALPYGQVALLVSKIQGQVNMQLTPPPVVDAAAESVGAA